MSPASAVLRSWGQILRGRQPALSLEITKECPLRCPGCYAYDAAHLGPGQVLRDLSDLRGDRLVERVLALAQRLRPLHISLVGGDPLVRYRELEQIVPQLTARGIHVQVVTSAFRPLPAGWAAMPRLTVVVSIDGLQPDHDQRRRPATYERILRHIAGQRIVVHCTMTALMTRRADYLEDFVRFWSASPQVEKIWMSIFTPQIGAEHPEIPSSAERQWIISELDRLRRIYPRLAMPAGVIAALHHPPASPRDCIFAQVTRSLTADLSTRITPCQFGGQPDCGRCGCYASMALSAIGEYRLPGGIPAGRIYQISARIGAQWSQSRGSHEA